MLCRVELVYLSIKHIERICVPKRAHELSLTLCYALVMELIRKPWSRVCVEIPPDSVCAVFSQCLEWVNSVAL